MEKIAFKEGSYGFFAELDYEELQIYSQLRPMRCRAVCLTCRQCIEKYLKQVIRENGARPGDPLLQGHNLLRAATKAGYPNTEKYRQELLSLGKLYFDGRYPNETDGYMFVEPTPTETAKAIVVAEDVRNWTIQELGMSADTLRSSLRRMELK